MNIETFFSENLSTQKENYNSEDQLFIFLNSDFITDTNVNVTEINNKELNSPNTESVSSPSNSDNSPQQQLINPSVDNESNNIIQEPITLTLYHKPRGSQGTWQEVLAGQGLRVTKGKGKKLKLHFVSRDDVIMNKQSLDVYLVDLSLSPTIHSKEGITIENEKFNENLHILDIEIKLTKYCKRVQIMAIMNTNMGIFHLRTVEFCSHNNGRQPSIVFVTENNSNLNKKRKNENEENFPQFLSNSNNKIESNQQLNLNNENTHFIDGPLKVNGIVQAKAFMQFSDERLKTNITDLIDALEIVTKLQGKSYQWKNGVLDNTSGGKKVIGLIAQEVQKVLPEVVNEDPNTGLLSVSYIEIIPVIIEAFKQHLLEFQNDKTDIHQQLSELKNKIEKVEKDQEKKNFKSTLNQNQISQIIKKMQQQKNILTESQNKENSSLPEIRNQSNKESPLSKNQEHNLLSNHLKHSEINHQKKDTAPTKRNLYIFLFLITLGLIFIITSLVIFGTAKNKFQILKIFILLLIIGILLVLGPLCGFCLLQC